MTTRTAKELIEIYNATKRNKVCEKIKFTGIRNMDVYNITAPFKDQDETIIAGRVECRNNEDSSVMFFTEKDGTWSLKMDAPVFKLQDPFISRIKGELIFGGVKTYPYGCKSGVLGYKTIFYRGSGINDLKKFSEGPEMMKDIRILELPEGRIAVFTRHQGQIGGRGKIGFVKINSLDELNISIINSARILQDLFIDEEWGGTNELHILKNRLLGVLGHIACFDTLGNRHYYPMTFAFDPYKEEAFSIKVIALRNELLPGAAKRPDLIDIVFSGGLVRQQNGKAELYVGVGDAEAQKVLIDDPFLEYEMDSIRI